MKKKQKMRKMEVKLKILDYICILFMDLKRTLAIRPEQKHTHIKAKPN